MDKKEVQITAYYFSVLGTMQTQQWSTPTIAEAREFVESHSAEIEEPKYELTSKVKQEDGKEYDVSRFVKYSYSHVDIIDYTDGREIEVKENVEPTNNE